MEDVLNDKSLSKSGQSFSFDALMTTRDIIKKIHSQNKFYIAKVKGNQKLLRTKLTNLIEDLTPQNSYI
jgi:transposase